MNSTRNARSVGIAVALVVGFALSGCTLLGSSGEPASAPSAGGSGTPETSSTPTAPSPTTPTPTPTPTQTRLTIGTEGIGDLVVGRPVPANSTAVRFDPKACNVDSAGGQWVSAIRGQQFSLSTEGGKRTAPISTLGVFRTDVSTVEGIRVGSTTAAFTAAYAGRFTKTVGYSTTVYAIKGTRGQLVVEIGLPKAATAGLIEKKQADRVMWMLVFPVGTKVQSIANSDGYGNCHG